MNVIINKVKQYLNDHKADALIIKSNENRLWATNFSSSYGFAIITNDKINLFLDGRYFQKAIDTIKDHTINILNLKSLNSVFEFCQVNKITSILLEGDYLTFNEYQFFSEHFEKITCITSKNLRIEKTESEIEKIKKAADITVETLQWIRKKIKPDKYSEKEVAALIIFKMMTLGADKQSFDPIIASGVNGAYAHHEPTDKIIADGEYVTIDIGCIYQGYCSDITRTFLVGKKAKNPEMNKIYQLVLQANTQAIAALKVNKTGDEIDNICREIIDQAGYGQYFKHSTGHGVGIEVHELPVIGPKSSDVIKENIIFTIEPGIYVPGVGGVRIEDMVYLAKNNQEVVVLSNKATK